MTIRILFNPKNKIIRLEVGKLKTLSGTRKNNILPAFICLFGGRKCKIIVSLSFFRNKK